MFWVGAGDAIAVGAAVLTTVSGTAAAWRRRAIDQLPLELAERAAIWEGMRGPEITVRAWLGRGRRVESIVAEAWMDDAALPVLAHSGPAVGRFQAVISGLPDWHAARELKVRVTVRAAGQDWSVERVYAPTDRSVGRFSPGFRARGGLSFEPGSWNLLS